MAAKPPFQVPQSFSVEEVIQRNREYSSTKHRQLPPLLQMLGNDIENCAPHTIVVSCLDSRANPYEVLGFKPYEIICIRNVSGRISTNLTDIATLDAFFKINQIIILHHTNCGVTHFTPEHHRNDIRNKHPHLTAEEFEAVIKMSPVRPDDEEGLKKDLKVARECRFLRKEMRANVIGLYLDVKTGLVREVKVSPSSL